MKASFKFGVIAATLWMTTALFGIRSADASCCPFACNGCTIQSQGQINLAVMDREHGRVRLVPNIRFSGNARDLALVVPTPAQPSFAPVDRALWQELNQLTFPLGTVTGSGNVFGCGGKNLLASGPSNEGGVTVVSRDTVGGFAATVLSSDESGALVRWLHDHDFAVDTSQAAAFDPYIQRHWFFTAMKLDTLDPRNQVPPDGWDASVAPVEVSFAATSLEVPLPLIAINRAPYMKVTFYVVDDHRVSLPGYTLRYANKLTATEMAAIKSAYPVLGGYLRAGRTLTRMDHTYEPAEPMSASVTVARASTDAEFHWKARGTGAADASSGFFLLVLLPWGAQRWAIRRRLRSRQPGLSGDDDRFQ